MPSTYESNDRRLWFNAPQFTRQRHRYRGVRESEKVNLEIDQLAYSIKALYVKYNDFWSKLLNHASILRDGGEIQAYYNEEVDLIDLEGVRSQASRIEQLRKRIESLEKA